MPEVSLTSRCKEILTALTHKVRLLTLPQIARTWWAGTRYAESNANKRLKHLEQAGFVTRKTLLAHPELCLTAPVFCWQPRSPEPDFGPVAYRLKSRWTEPVVPTTVVIATDKTKQQLGGYIGNRVPRTGEVTHDIHLSQVYLWHRTYRPELARRWVTDIQQFAEGKGRSGTYPDAIVIRLADATCLPPDFNATVHSLLSRCGELTVSSG